MILSRDELRRLAVRRRLNLGALEKEYVLDLLLRSISRREDLRQVLVLKGGTALHRFFVGRRLSLDLDFTASRLVTVDELRSSLEIEELRAFIAEYRVFHDALTISRLKYVGPLNYANSVKIDISFRENVLLPPLDIAASSPYGDDFRFRVMQPTEIAAEKLRAITMRQAPRDVYDLWIIAEQQLADAQGIAALASVKLTTVGLELKPETIVQRIAAVESIWRNDLSLLTADVPEFDRVLAVLLPWLDRVFG